VKSENIKSADLRVSLPDDAGAKGLQFAAVRGAADWTRIEQRFTVAKGVRPRYVCVWLEGPGRIWVDDFAFEGRTGGLNWTKTVELDPAGLATQKAVEDALAKEGAKVGGFVNFYTGRWPCISFIGGMAMGNVSEHLEFFYEKPFRYWTHVLDYVMEGGGKKYGIRATIRRYKEQGKVEGHRSFILQVRCDTQMKDCHPSYILANGRRIWDSKKHPVLEGKYIVAPFWQEESGDPVIDLVTDLDYTPEVKGLAFRMFSVRYAGDAGVKAGLKGASEQAEGSPADKLERFTFGLFPSGYDFWTEDGPRIDDLSKKWKPNFRPEYPVDDVFLSPEVFTTQASGDYHDFMLTHGGCNVLATGFKAEILKQAGFVRAALCPPKDVEAAKKVLEPIPISTQSGRR
jgi:hypothetical protein